MNVCLDFKNFNRSPYYTIDVFEKKKEYLFEKMDGQSISQDTFFFLKGDNCLLVPTDLLLIVDSFYKFNFSRDIYILAFSVRIQEKQKIGKYLPLEPTIHNYIVDEGSVMIYGQLTISIRSYNFLLIATLPPNYEIKAR